MNQGRVQRSRLLGRRSEREALDRLLSDALAGQSRVTVLRGEAGVGKSALLSYLSEQVAGWHVMTAVGVESEMELAYSGLHQLCRPILDHLDRLPVPQRQALATVFGQSAGSPPDRFLVGLAALTLFADAAEQQPLLCIVDDAQWLDHASAQILAFVGRRLLAERIALVCAARTGTGDEILAGLPEFPVHGLGDSDARALLLDNVYGPLDAAVCDQIVSESHGNPLALLELPRSWNVADLAGGFGLPSSQPVVGKIEQSYAGRLHLLPSQTRLLVLAAAAEPLGDPVLLHRAAGTLGVHMAAADPAVDAGLLRIAGRVEFAHPLVRSAVYRSAAAEDRHRVHDALAEATDPETDPDRRAWHRARATPEPGEEVAAELERSAGRAQARGGVAAAAAFLQRAVALTGDPRRRAERALAAAEASFQAGAFDAALGLVATEEAGALDEFQRARVDLLRGDVAFASGAVSDAPPLLLKAAKRLEPVNVELARQTYLTAWSAASVAGELGGSGVLPEICRAVQALRPRPGGPRPLDLLLDGLALLTTDGHAAATPTLQRAATALLDIPLEDVLRWGWVAPAASNAVWDNDGARAISARQVQLVRDAGALAGLPLHLSALGIANAWIGDFAGAASNIAEADSVAAATGSQFFPWALLRLAGTPREGSRGLRSDRERDRASRWRIARRGDLGALGCRRPVQRPRPLRGGDGVGPAIHIEHLRAVGIRMGASRARRGGRAYGRHRSRTRCARPACGDDATLRHRRRSRYRGPLSGAAERGRHRRGAAIAKRSIGSAVRSSVRSSLARICCTASGCAEKAVASTRASSCVPPTTCSSRSGWRRSPNAHAASWPPPARTCASPPPTRATSSLRRSTRSPGSPGTACRTQRSAPSSSSARARSSGTSARCSPSSASAPAGSFGRRFPSTAGSSRVPSALERGQDQVTIQA